MPTQKAQLRDLRAANVAIVDYHVDGSFKRVEFFPPFALQPQPAQAQTEQTQRQQPPFQGTVDLLRDVVMAPEQEVKLDASDFPPEVIEAMAAVDADDYEPESE